MSYNIRDIKCNVLVLIKRELLLWKFSMFVFITWLINQKLVRLCYRFPPSDGVASVISPPIITSTPAARFCQFPEPFTSRFNRHSRELTPLYTNCRNTRRQVLIATLSCPLQLPLPFPVALKQLITDRNRNQNRNGNWNRNPNRNHNQKPNIRVIADTNAITLSSLSRYIINVRAEGGGRCSVQSNGVVWWGNSSISLAFTFRLFALPTANSSSFCSRLVYVINNRAYA